MRPLILAPAVSMLLNIYLIAHLVKMLQYILIIHPTLTRVSRMGGTINIFNVSMSGAQSRTSWSVFCTKSIENSTFTGRFSDDLLVLFFECMCFYIFITWLYIFCFIKYFLVPYYNYSSVWTNYIVIQTYFLWSYLQCEYHHQRHYMDIWPPSVMLYQCSSFTSAWNKLTVNKFVVM